MIEKNLNSKTGVNELLSEESEDYTLDDIIQLHKVEDETDSQGNTRKVLLTKNSGQQSSSNTSARQFKPAAGKSSDYKLIFDNHEFNLKDVKDVDAVMKKISGILGSNVTGNVNRFSNMTYCEEVLRVLYQSLENISRNRGNAKEIIEIGSKIETIESEKQKQFISQDEINKTIEDIKSVVTTLSKIQSILENS